MKKRPLLLLGLGAVVSAGLALVALGGVRATAAGDAPAPPKPCCFTNEQFAGVCRVVPNTGETCDDIQAYLNNPSSSGRTYCDNTNLRSGWQRVDCATGKPEDDASGAARRARRASRPASGGATPGSR